MKKEIELLLLVYTASMSKLDPNQIPIVHQHSEHGKDEMHHIFKTDIKLVTRMYKQCQTIEKTNLVVEDM